MRAHVLMCFCLLSTEYVSKYMSLDHLVCFLMRIFTVSF